MGAKKVAAGAAWLDENFPGWEREIDLGTLDLRSCDACVCGQSLRKYAAENIDYFMDGFNYALEVFEEGFTWAENHGFFVMGDDDDWIEVETLWRDLIKER